MPTAHRTTACLPAIALLLTIGCSGGCSGGAALSQNGDGGGDGGQDDAGLPFFAEPPAVYVAKVKNLLVGLPPTDDEVKAVVADPSKLKALIDGWMTLPEYQQKMLVFFELAFQQTQINAADFVDLIPKTGIGAGVAVPLLLQNIRESFARTALALIAEGRPLSEAMTTKRLMLTPPLMELYAFLDTYHVDDAANISDAFAAANKNLKIYIEAAAGPIPIAQTIDPASPNFMHWYDPDVPKLTWPSPDCAEDPIVIAASSYALHYLLYGAVYSHKGPSGFCAIRPGTAAGVQFTGDDFNAWKMVSIRPPKMGEATTRFYDLPTLRSASELVIRTPRPGFFTTPAFFANWPTNQSNQMRVTINQALIVSTGMAVDGNDDTRPMTTPGLDAAHAPPGGACFACHQTLDPSRAILSSTYSYAYYTQTNQAQIAQKGLFAFKGVIAPVSSIDDLAHDLATHPALPAAWAQKLCYYANSAPCLEADPEFQRVVAAFQSSNLSWNTLVRELLASPLTTNATSTLTATTRGEVVAVARRDHLCAALNARLGLLDVCGLDVASRKTAQTTVPEIAAGLPSDGYGRGATAPVLPNAVTLFYRAGVENICEAVSALVIDAAVNPANPGAKHWSSAQPAAAIAEFVSLVMGLVPSDPRAAAATTILTAHNAAALKTGASAGSALKSTFIAACLSPSAIGIGM